MKKQIDPNLDGFDDELFLNIDETPSDFEAASEPSSDGGFMVKEAENTGSEADYHASQHTHHSSTHHSHSHHSGSHHSHSHHSGSHHSSSEKKKSKKKLPAAARIALIIFIILFALVIIVVGTLFLLEHKGKQSLTSTNVTTQENFEETITYNGHEYVYNDDIISIAFMGIDKRDLGLDDDIVGTAGQADANIVITIDTKTGAAKAIAIPRDTMVEVELYSQNGIFLRNEEMQLCLSYAYGNGTDTSAANVTTSISRILYNVPVTKYFALDLNGIAPINDAIGGVTLTSIYDFKNLDIKKGDEVHLIGDLTEAYVRTRDMDNIEASLNRTQRQVQYIKAFAAQLAPAVINDFSVVSELYKTAADYSSTNITLSDATYLASLLISKGINDFDTVTLEGEMVASDDMDNADVVFAEFYPDEDKLMQVVLDTFYTQIS